MNRMKLNDPAPLNRNRIQPNQPTTPTGLINLIFTEVNWHNCHETIQHYLQQGHSFTNLYSEIQGDLDRLTGRTPMPEEAPFNGKAVIKRAYLILHEIDQHIQEGRASLYQSITNLFARIFFKPSYWSTINQLIQIEQAEQAANLEVFQPILTSAISIARSISDPYDKASALTKIAVKQANYNALQEAEATFQEALTAAQGIQGPDHKINLFGTIPKELMEVNPQQAQQALQQAINAADTINVEDEPSGKVETLVELAKIQTKVNPIQAEQTFEEAVGIATMLQTEQREKPLGKALHLVAVAQAKTNPTQALTTANLIQEAKHKAIACMKVATELAKSNSNLALQTAREIENHYWKVVAFKRIAKKLSPEEAKQTLNQALHLAEEIEDPTLKATALKKIASALAKINLTQALETANGINIVSARDAYNKALAFIKIAEEQTKTSQEEAQKTLDQALVFANKITDDILKVCAVRKIAKSQAKTDPDKALTTAKTIIDSGILSDSKLYLPDTYQADTHEEIALELAKTDLQKALNLVNPFHKIRKGVVLRKIVAELAKTNPERAEEIANEIEEPYSKVIALLSIIQDS